MSGYSLKRLYFSVLDSISRVRLSPFLVFSNPSLVKPAHFVPLPFLPPSLSLILLLMLYALFIVSPPSDANLHRERSKAKSHRREIRLLSEVEIEFLPQPPEPPAASLNLGRYANGREHTARDPTVGRVSDGRG